MTRINQQMNFVIHKTDAAHFPSGAAKTFPYCLYPGTYIYTHIHIRINHNVEHENERELSCFLLFFIVRTFTETMPRGSIT